MAMEYEKSEFSREDIKRYALTEDPSTVTMIGSANLGKGGETGSTVTRDIHSDATSEKHSAPSHNNTKNDEMDQNASGDGSNARGMVSDLTATTEGSYGGGLYGTDRTPSSQDMGHASDFQSAEGPASDMPTHKEVHQPPSSGDRATDITGISYIQ